MGGFSRDLESDVCIKLMSDSKEEVEVKGNDESGDPSMNFRSICESLQKLFIKLPNDQGLTKTDGRFEEPIIPTLDAILKEPCVDLTIEGTDITNLDDERKEYERVLNVEGKRITTESASRWSGSCCCFMVVKW